MTSGPGPDPAWPPGRTLGELEADARAVIDQHAAADGLLVCCAGPDACATVAWARRTVPGYQPAAPPSALGDGAEDAP